MIKRQVKLKPGQFAVMLNKDTHKKVKLLSAETGKSMGRIVQIAVENLKTDDPELNELLMVDEEGEKNE